MRIGYAPYAPAADGPGDRRRFAAYARQRGLDWEIARLDGEYDVVVATHNTDLPGWIARKRREGDRFKLIFELIDSYLTVTSLPHRFAKGVARRLLGTDSGFSPDFLSTLHEICSVADAVICSTQEQLETIRRMNPNVVISFDWFGDELGPPKQDYTAGDRLRIVWEGMAVTLSGLMMIAPVLNELADRIDLHVVTDPAAPRLLGRFGRRSTEEVLRAIKAPVTFHPWEKATFSDHIRASDLAIIPLGGSNPMMIGKPENKLVLLWQLGMPVLTGATPAYRKTMARAGIDMTCATLDDWRRAILDFDALAAHERAALAQKARIFALTDYSAERFRAAFDRAFALAGYDLSAASAS